MKVFLMILIIPTLILGCATGKVIIPEIQNDYEIEADFETVWLAVVESLAERSSPIEAIEKESGLITTSFVSFFSGRGQKAELDRIAAKPNYGFMATWSRGRYKFNVFVRSKSDGTTLVKITSHIEAFESTINEDWIVCFSRGVIEDDLFDLIKAKI